VKERKDKMLTWAITWLTYKMMDKGYPEVPIIVFLSANFCDVAIVALAVNVVEKVIIGT